MEGTRCGSAWTPARRSTGLTCSMLRGRRSSPEGSRTTRPTSRGSSTRCSAFAEEDLWAIDQPGGSAALLLALLWERDQKVLYVPGLAVDRAREAYPGESKTDARDAYIIAEQARMRSDLARLVPGEDDLAELQLLLARRRDLVADRTRCRQPSQGVLLSLFPALERALDLNAKGALVLVRHYQTPAAIRRMGHKRLAAYLKNRAVKGAEGIARKALAAAKAQSVSLPAEERRRHDLRRARRRGARPQGERSRPRRGDSGHVFSPVPRLGSSLACPAWVRSSVPSSW